jgi:sigma-E factor negative regulatory protein RseA
VIGDVLRSEELAGCRDDARFVQALRLRLAAEPVVLAPSPSDAGRRTSRWAVPAAIAAGFVLVVGAFTVTRPIGEGPASSPLAREGSPTTVASREPAAAVVAGPPATSSVDARFADGRMVRDPRLDAYLAAHKQFAGTTALAVPSAWLRAAPAEAPSR